MREKTIYLCLSLILILSLTGCGGAEEIATTEQKLRIYRHRSGGRKQICSIGK